MDEITILKNRIMGAALTMAFAVCARAKKNKKEDAMYGIFTAEDIDAQIFKSSYEYMKEMLDVMMRE